MDGYGVNATLKAGTTFDAPWIVVNGESPDDLHEKLNGISNELLLKVAQTAHLLQGAYAAGNLTLPQPTVETPPQAPTQVPAQQAQAPVQQPPQRPQPQGPTCVHGARVRRTGTSKRGDWAAWFCPTPKGTYDQCGPEWE